MIPVELDKISTKAAASFDKKDTKEKTASILLEVDEMQNLLYAESKHSLLVIIQGMDASGKDGAIKNVLGTLNPQGIMVKSFKAPSEEELSHDFLWRIHPHAPAKGMMQVFNRSHYEDVLITRVHGWCDDETAYKRMQAINNFEHLLAEHNSTQILKFYLHVSQEEQQKRLQERLDNPEKRWKHNAKDFDEAVLWKTYMKMYEDCFANCNLIPWIIVPADQNWYKEYIIATAIKDTLHKLDMKYPGID